MPKLLAASWNLPLLVVVGWVVRAPLVRREEGHEAITRMAWDGLALTPAQQGAIIRGVRAPDISVIGLLSSTLPFAQRRHALRAWSGSTTADGIQQMRDFMTSRHLRALARPDGARRWEAFGQVLHCLQDSYSPAHVDRSEGQIARMKHWGPLDRLRRALASGSGTDEHGFLTDRRDSPWRGKTLTAEASAAATASRGYLELVASQSAAGRSAEVASSGFAWFLDECVGG